MGSIKLKDIGKLKIVGGQVGEKKDILDSLTQKILVVCAICQVTHKIHIGFEECDIKNIFILLLTIFI